MVVNLAELSDLWGDPVSSLPALDLQNKLGSVCTDSRKLKSGDFFVPLKGENFDGHSFLRDAFRIGAQAAVVSNTFKGSIPSRLLHWVVDDTLLAYQQLGLLHRCKLKIPVIAVTGSVGKTTTRELIKASLGPLGKIASTTHNNNNDIGVALTLLSADSTHAAVVIEMGMRGLGQIKRLSQYTQPNMAVITNIGSAHIGLLGSRRNIARAKCEITTCLDPGGVVIIPAYDSLLEEELNRVWSGRVLRVILDVDSLHGITNQDSGVIQSREADLKGTFILNKAIISLKGYNFSSPLEGSHNAKNFLLALAVAQELGIPFQKLQKLDVAIPSGRQHIIYKDDITIIDETYNSSPESVVASLDLLIAKPGRHFAVLGTMLELGSQSLSMHRYIAEYAVQLGVDGLVIIADSREAEVMGKVAKPIPYFVVASTYLEALPSLKSWLKPGDVVLLKASRAVGLERLIPLI